jgi:hypothetical protein
MPQKMVDKIDAPANELPNAKLRANNPTTKSGKSQRQKK